ncbi:hypothetical protein OHT57_00485 [Streptomyces sp. NBC_00285]|uniref:hypothetical protein n=1 Tax=Streptomyces sp. NBC_00285 TaxID=2975700 RepID=UPI002E2A01F1|nr:hypothetical protein [Streptomyces sp. NBC_00285]
MPKLRMQKSILLGASLALAAAAMTFGVAHADSSGISTADAEIGMPSAVEDFSYPNAAKIEAETGAVLKRGDGHLLLMSCDGSEDIKIESVHGQQYFCFRVAAKPAFLTLEIPKAYGIWTTDDPVEATVQKDDGTSTVIDAPAGGFTGYGEAGADRQRTTLIELRVEG